MKQTLAVSAALSILVFLASGAAALAPEPTGVPDASAPDSVPEPGVEAGLPEPEHTACTVQPAQANDDYWTTSKNTPITASPIANDPDTPQNNFGGMTQPSHGTTEQVGIDAVKYTPDTGFTGSDSFNYTHVGCLQCYPDSSGWCSEPDFDIGTVYVTVTD